MAFGDSSIALDPGTYNIQSAVLHSGVKISSKNPKQPAILRMVNNHPSAPMIQGRNLKNITFENVVLDGNFSNQPGQVRGRSDQILINLDNCSNLTFRGCTFRNGAGDAINMNGCSDVLVEDNIFHDMGHDCVYCRYDTYGVTVRKNDIKTRTNSGVRISYGGKGYDIYDNKIWSWLDRASTGPGIEIDKNNIADIEIWNNTFSTMNGAGIWMPSNGGTAKNIHIHDNVFENVGQYYTTSGKYEDRYNGYSCGAITGAGFNGILIENNIFKNLKHIVCLNEWKYNCGGNFTWQFNNNKVENSDIGFRIDLVKGNIVGSGNKLDNVKKFSHGFTNNVKLTASSSPNIETPKPNTPEAIENMSGEIEQIKVVIKVTDGAGRTGTQTIVMDGIKEKPSTLEKVTLKLSQNGNVGNRTYSLPATTNSQPVGTDWLVELAITRGAITDNHSFILPGIAGTGINELKYRAKDGLYCESPLDIIMSDVPETVPEPVVKPKQYKFIRIYNVLDNGNIVFENEIVEVVN